jgi:hypothetical protein
MPACMTIAVGALREKARMHRALHGDEWSTLVWVTWFIHFRE